MKRFDLEPEVYRIGVLKIRKLNGEGIHNMHRDLGVLVAYPRVRPYQSMQEAQDLWKPYVSRLKMPYSPSHVLETFNLAQDKEKLNIVLAGRAGTEEHEVHVTKKDEKHFAYHITTADPKHLAKILEAMRSHILLD